ncbi:MAG: 2-oxoacid:acceptor oxidoreductase family protein [Armatimonadetes bacterium]|nr:2-oxoacid:acceptor oxidoreductase family protein [Armatimonadota bacterium]
MAKLNEVRWHGRGGQGAKTASYILAIAAAEDGWNVQAFPEYGAERRGAPMKSYVRISDEPIRLRCAVLHPQVVVVLDSTLLGSENVTDGVPDGGIVIVNTGDSPEEVRAKIAKQNIQVCTVNATQISLDTVGRDIPNTPMLGALAKVSDLVTVEGAKAAVRKQLGTKLSEAVLEGNMQAITRANEEVQVG